MTDPEVPEEPPATPPANSTPIDQMRMLDILVAAAVVRRIDDSEGVRYEIGNAADESVLKFAQDLIARVTNSPGGRYPSSGAALEPIWREDISAHMVVSDSSSDIGEPTRIIEVPAPVEFEEPAPVAEVGVDILPGELHDYTGESVQPHTLTRELVPHEEQTRRGILIGLGLAFAAVFLLQLALALALSNNTWDRVGPVLTSASTLVTGALGYALGYYFSGKD